MTDRLRKITLNLFATDCNEMERIYGYGWSEKVRTLVHEHIRDARKLKRRIEDLYKEESYAQRD